MYDESCLPRIGSNIRLLRGACQFNQQQFAERIGISQTHLSNIEHNNVQVSLKLLVRQRQCFGLHAGNTAGQKSGGRVGTGT